MQSEEIQEWNFEIGLQAWSCRNLIARSPQEAFIKSNDFDFIELAGHGSDDLKTFSTLKNIPADKIKGAHICSLNNGVEEIYSLVDAYINRFPKLQWMAFFFDYRRSGKNDSYLFNDENPRLVESYNKYAKLLKEIERRYAGTLSGPKVIYHLYPVDFVPVSSYTIDQRQIPKPAFEILLERGVSIQIDLHFARIVGFDLLSYFKSFSSKRFNELFFEKTHQGSETSCIPLIPSVHIAGFTAQGIHEALDFSICTCGNSEAQDRRYNCARHYYEDLLEVLRQLACKNLIIEFEQDQDLSRSRKSLYELKKILKKGN